MDEHLRIEFNEWARAGRGEGMEKGHRPVGEQAIELMEIQADSRILDLGCGSGWASRLMAEKAQLGKVIGIDISDEMVQLATNTSTEFSNLEFKIASAEALPFGDNEFTHVFSMESLYYYSNMLAALKEVYRVMGDGARFVTVVDLYLENEPSHQWIPILNVPVQLVSIPNYHDLFEQAGFLNVQDQRLFDPEPIPDDYSGGSFTTRDDYLLYKQNGSLMLSAEVRK